MIMYILIAGAAGIAIGILLMYDNSIATEQENGPLMHDQSLMFEVVAEGLESPTSMAFIGDDRLLVLQKNDGKVHLISGEERVSKPILKVDVANEVERGLLGIDVWNNSSVFLYMTD